MWFNGQRVPAWSNPHGAGAGCSDEIIRIVRQSSAALYLGCTQPVPPRGSILTKPDDAFVKPAARRIVKEPRGSKLDAKRRAEYEAEVARAEAWDTSAWPTWTVTGRVLPERCDVWVARTGAQAAGAMGRVKFRVEVIRSQIAAVCAVEGSLTVYEIADAVRSTLAFPVDYIAFQNRAAYEIVLDLCINNQTGEAQAIPVDEPTFATEDAGLCFDARANKSNLTIPYLAGGVPELATTLHDLTSAVRYPRRTFRVLSDGGGSGEPTLRSPKHKASQ
jgi:hypothetical protein